MQKVFIKDKQGNKVLPITHVSAVLDSEGNDLDSHLGEFEDEVRGLVDTPHQNYVTVAATSSTTAATDVLPNSGQSADTIYRVSNWDGSANNGAGAYNVTKYSEYAWDDVSDPNKYIFLCTKSAIGEVFDITAYNNNTKYTDLAAALGTNGANIPEAIRKGGMSVKFVLSSDNKYIQFRCMAQNFTTDVTQWQGVDTAPVVGSKNLAESGGIFRQYKTLKNDVDGLIGNVQDDFDLGLSDESGHILVKFGGGHVKTKNFDSSTLDDTFEQINDTFEQINDSIDDIEGTIEEPTNLPVYTNNSVSGADLNIADENNKSLVKFYDGHIKTKNFDSKQTVEKVDELEQDIDNIIALSYGVPKTNLFGYNFELLSEIPSDFETNNNWSIDNGVLVNDAIGVANAIYHKSDIDISFNEKETRVKFNIAADSTFAVLWKSVDGYNMDGSMFSVTNTKLRVHEAFTDPTSVPNVRTEKTISLVNGKDYILYIKKECHTNIVAIYDGVTGGLIEKIIVTQTATTGADEFAGGRQMNVFGIAAIAGSVNIKSIYCNALCKDPLIVVYGDSITEGDRVYADDTYVQRMKEYFGESRVYNSGYSGTTITSVWKRAQYEIPKLKPKYAMISIGTNGQNVQLTFMQLYNFLIAQNVIPIFNVIPMMQDPTNVNTVRTIVMALDCMHTRFDIATAVNNNIESGQNASLFADGIHPNKQGHQKMWERMLIDLDRLFNE